MQSAETYLIRNSRRNLRSGSVKCDTPSCPQFFGMAEPGLWVHDYQSLGISANHDQEVGGGILEPDVYSERRAAYP